MIDSLTLTTLVISLLLAVLCASSTGENKSKSMLSLLFALIAIQSGFKYLGFTNSFLHEYPVFLVFPEIAGIITPAVIYLFVLRLLHIRFSRYLIIRMSILPVFALIMFFVFFFLTAGFTKDVYYVLENFIILLMVNLASYIIYVVLSFKKINRSLIHETLEIDNHTRVVLFWVRLLLGLMLFRAFIGLVYFGLQLTMSKADWFPLATDLHKSTIAVTLFISTILTAYYALRNPDLFDSLTEKRSFEQNLALAIVPSSEKRALKKKIDDDEITGYLRRIESVVEQEKLFLNSNLNAGFLAEKVGLPVYKVTLSLNKGLGKNLNEFINTYRVEHAKKLLSDPANSRLTIYSIALDSGFASEAPFYAAFKKNAGISPSAYRSQVLGSNTE